MSVVHVNDANDDAVRELTDKYDKVVEVKIRLRDAASKTILFEPPSYTSKSVPQVQFPNRKLDSDD